MQQNKSLSLYFCAILFIISLISKFKKLSNLIDLLPLSLFLPAIILQYYILFKNT